MGSPLKVTLVGAAVDVAVAGAAVAGSAVAVAVGACVAAGLVASTVVGTVVGGTFVGGTAGVGVAQPANKANNKMLNASIFQGFNSDFVFMTDFSFF
jgi:hypothetical protein